MEKPNFIHPANVEELANIAAETGAEVLRGPLTYPSETGGLQLGDLDLSEYLHRYRDCEVTLIIAATGEAEEKPIVCGICGFVLDEVSECPRCKLMNEEAARQIRARQEERTAMLGEVDDILRGQGGE
jgi:phage FluMu protein Com